MRRRVGLLLALGVVGVLPAPVHAAPPNPFGHACAPQEGVLFCPTATDGTRVPSFDGVPLDVDVTLPASGDGPFPTIVMMHGWGGDKTSFEGSTAANGYNNVSFAQQGYAVVNYSARGFGRSCGRPDSRTSPGCDAGWIHLADHRFEVRDTQHLLGLLVDQGVAKPGALGVTGISYGGIQSLNLARLRN
ncbi:MAG TPA: alpha/beta fold hydrolase, partial [Thermoleophilaceae bacterium]